MIHISIHRLLLLFITLMATCHTHVCHAIGEWKLYNGTSSFTQATFFNQKLFAISGSSLCSFDPTDEGISHTEYNRISGLSGSSVSRIYATRSGDYLCITSHDGNIDILDTQGTFWNIPDLYCKAMNESKEICSILEGDDNLLYLSGEFGFLQIDPDQKIVLQSVQNRKEIDFAFSYEGTLYRCSRQGRIEYCDNLFNVSDSKCWQQLEGATDATIVSDAKLFISDEKLYCWFISADTYIHELSSGHCLTRLEGINQCNSIHPLANRVLIGGNGYVAMGEPDSRTFSVSNAQPFISCTSFLSQNDSAFYALHDYYGILDCKVTDYMPNTSLQLTTDVNEGLVTEGICTSYLGALSFTPDNQIVGIARRSATTGYSGATALAGCISRFDSNQDEWENVSIQGIIKRLSYRPYFNGLTSLAIDPIHKQRYAIGSWLFGLYIIDNDTLLCRYDETTSNGGVEQFDPTFSSTRVTAVAYDDDGRLFFANSMQDTVLRCLDTDGKIYKYPNPGFAKVSDAVRILLAQHDGVKLKWVLNDYGYKKSRIGLYYDKGIPPSGINTISTQGEYQTAWFNTLVDQDLNEYIPNYIYDLYEDLDGKVWVLTSNGPFVVDDPISTFNYAQQNPGKGRVRRVKIPRNDGTNLADYLMESTDCICMAVDNFNRKWIGTRDAGLYLMSSDCITTIEHFTTDNSPLLSDGILALAYDHESGLLYISCEGGVLSYQTDAIESEDDFSSFYCYPNPVLPEFSGELRIMGLMNDSFVSITDAAGNLIFRTRSEGTTTTWNLRDSSGERVSPGVYLIHGVNAKGSKGSICKFLIL